MSPFSGHLWYLGALLLVLLIAKAFRKSNLEHYVFPIIPVLLAVDLVFGKYSLCIWGREFPVELPSIDEYFTTEEEMISTIKGEIKNYYEQGSNRTTYGRAENYRL